MDLNARAKTLGTWILAIVFSLHAAASFAAFYLLLRIVAHAANALWWFLAVVGVTLCLPAALAVGGLYLWRKTHYPWLAIVPALISAAMVGVPASLVLGWNR